MKLPGIVLALMIGIPAAAVAQRGGDARPGRGETDPNEAVFSSLSSRQIQRFDAVKVVLDKKRDYKLDDKQIADLTQLETQEQWNIKRLSARIDSAQKLMNKEGGGGGTPDFGSVGRGGRGRGGGDENAKPETPAERRDRVLLARRTIIEAVGDLQVEYESSKKLVLSMLRDAALASATDLFKKHDDDLAKLLKDAGIVTKTQH